MSGTRQLGTVLGLRENDNAVGCNAPTENLPEARWAADGGHGGRRCPAIIVQNRISDEREFLESGNGWVAI